MHDSHPPGYEWSFHHTLTHLKLFAPHLHLALLRSCSQIYMEAALIPFIKNTFTFANADLLSRFTSSLIPAQGAAITSLIISNISAADLLDPSYWEGFPCLRHLAVGIRGHKDCLHGDADLRDGGRSNSLYMSNARITWQNDPSCKPLDHLDLVSFSFNILCSCCLSISHCPTLRYWQQWSKTIEQRVLTTSFKARHENRRASGRQSPQIHPVGQLELGGSCVGNTIRKVDVTVRSLPFWLEDVSKEDVVAFDAKQQKKWSTSNDIWYLAPAILVDGRELMR